MTLNFEGRDVLATHNNRRQMYVLERENRRHLSLEKWHQDNILSVALGMDLGFGLSIKIEVVMEKQNAIT